MVNRTDIEASLIEQGRTKDRSGQPDWLAQLANEGGDQFEKNGLPHRRIEDWKYTDLRAKLRNVFAPAKPMGAGEKPALGPLVDVQSHHIALINGFFEGTLSGLSKLPQGVKVQPISEALINAPELLQSHLGKSTALQNHGLAGLNTALFNDGVVIFIEDGVVLESPIHISHHLTGKDSVAQFSRVLIVLGEGAKADVMESFNGPHDNTYFSNIVTEVFVAPFGRLRHYKMQCDGDRATHLQSIAVTLDADAHYESVTLSLGAALTRNETFVKFAGEGGSTKLCGAFLQSDKQHCDTTTWVDHAVPHCQSEEVFRGVLLDRSRGVFQGKISVQPQAQKTDARMMTKALLLSDHAEMDSKPELEIYADDVKCAHGATVGTLDEEALFYLQSRGIAPEAARSLLIEAFIEEPLELIKDSQIRLAFKRTIEEILEKRDGE